MTSPDDAATTLRARIRADLIVAMKARQPDTVATLRALLAAIDNAEAVPIADDPAIVTGSPIAGAHAGVGSTEVVRRSLAIADLHCIIGQEIAERQIATDTYRTVGETTAADRLEREIEILQDYLDD